MEGTAVRPVQVPLRLEMHASRAVWIDSPSVAVCHRCRALPRASTDRRVSSDAVAGKLLHTNTHVLGEGEASGMSDDQKHTRSGVQTAGCHEHKGTARREPGRAEAGQRAMLKRGPCTHWKIYSFRLSLNGPCPTGGQCWSQHPCAGAPSAGIPQMSRQTVALPWCLLCVVCANRPPFHRHPYARRWYTAPLGYLLGWLDVVWDRLDFYVYNINNDNILANAQT